MPAPGSGVLKIGVAEGETVAIGATVGRIDPAGTPTAAAGGPTKTAVAKGGAAKSRRVSPLPLPPAPGRGRRKRVSAALAGRAADRRRGRGRRGPGARDRARRPRHQGGCRGVPGRLATGAAGRPGPGERAPSAAPVSKPEALAKPASA